MKTSLAAVGLTAGLVAGGAAGLVLVPAAALGQTTAPPTSAPSDEDVPAERGQHLRGTLAPLVADGTLTQAQADKVIAALQAAKPLHGPGGRQHRLHIALDTVAKTLGVTEEQLRAALRGGQSIADVARSKGIAPQRVVDALLAEARTRLAKQVVAGDLTQADADARLTQAKGMFTSLVNGELPTPRGGMRGGGMRGPADLPAAGPEGSVERAAYPSA